MQFTNKYNFPPYIVDWLLHDGYDHNSDPRTISATGLMSPVRVKALTRRHESNLIKDISDLLASKVGSAVHDSIEQIETQNVLKENRVSKKITIADKEWTVTGKYDVLEQHGDLHILRDIKTTSVWAYIYGGKDESYRQQLSIYRWLLSDTIKVAPYAYIDFFFTDWQSSKAKREDNYPPLKASPNYRIDLMSLEDTESFVNARLVEFSMFENTEDNNLPFCTQEELWASEDSYAVKKPGGTRALRVVPTLQDAKNYLATAPAKSYIEHRPGKAKRCNYCSVAPVCNQYRQLLKANAIEY